MNSMGAILDKAIIICPEDEVDKHKYKVGEYFIVKKSTIKLIDNKLIKKYKGLAYKILAKHDDFIFRIDSYCIDCNGSLCYRLSTETYNSELIWQCSETELEQDFHKITNRRFAFIGE